MTLMNNIKFELKYNRYEFWRANGKYGPRKQIAGFFCPSVSEYTAWVGE